MKFIYTIVFVVTCVINTYSQISFTDAGYDGYRLVWSDEFNYTGHPDPTKWKYEKGYVRNKEIQYYTENRLENCRVENGMLIIEARHENPKFEGAEFTSASILTSGIASWKYGRIEARVKVPAGKGAWPAFWMKGINQL